MSLLGNIANNLLGPALTRGGDHLMDATMGMPGTSGERELMRRHDEWLRTAKLGVRYYSHDSRVYIIGDDAGAGPIRLSCSPVWMFTRQTRGGLYSLRGTHSYRAFLQAGFKGLTTTPPPMPNMKDLQLPRVTWELGEVEYAEEPALAGTR